MNKILRLSLISMLTFVCGMANAATATATFDWSKVTTTSAPTASVVYTNGDISLTFAKGTGSSIPAENKDGSIRMYGKTTLTIKTTDAYKISKVEFTPTGANYDATKLTYNGTAISDSWVLSNPTNEILLTATSNARFKTIVVTYLPKDEEPMKDADISYSSETVTTNLEESFTAPTLSNPNNLSITYSSSNENVAKISSDGIVNILGTGTTTIKADFAGDDKYYSSSVSYILNVVSTEVSLPYNETFNENIGSFKINNVSLDDGLTYVWAYNASKYMKASAFSGSNKAAESWLISPNIDIQNATKATLTFDQCINKYFGTIANEATLWIKEGDGEWTQKTITYPEITSGNWSSFETQTVDLSSYVNKKIKIAFKYISTADAAGTWEIKNFSVTDVTANINNIEASEDANAPQYNLGGQRVDKAYKGVVIKKGKKYIQK